MRAEPRRFLSIVSSIADSLPEHAFRQILNVGAGICSECQGLLELFPEAQITVLESDVQCVELLRTSLRGRSGLIQIVHSEAGQYLSSNPVTYDLVLVRHPNLDQNPQQWQTAFEAIWPRLNANGLLLATFFSYGEMEYVEQLFVSATNGHRMEQLAPSEPVPLDGRDRYSLGYVKHASGS